MLTFEFEARRRLGGESGLLKVAIHPPVRLPEPPHDFECRIVIDGVIDKETRAVGVVPLQAVDLAIQVSKAVVSAYAADWELFHDGDGPITLAY